MQAPQAMVSDGQVQQLIASMIDWPGVVLNSHRSASQPYHRLNFLADIGLKATDPGIGKIIEKMMRHVSEQ